MKKRSLVLIFFLLIVLFPGSAFAVTLTFTAPDQIADQPFFVETMIEGASPGQNYVRVDLYREGTTSYFGETYNGHEWVGGSDGKTYLPILIASSQAQITIQARLGAPSISKYSGSGSYKLRVRRYTASGAIAANDFFSPRDVQIAFIAPTSAPDPTSTPKIPTITPPKEVTLKPTLSVEEEEPEEYQRSYPTAVLGLKTKKDEISSPTPASLSLTTEDQDFLPYFFFLSGGEFVLICGILMYRNWKQNHL